MLKAVFEKALHSNSETIGSVNLNC